MIDPITRMAELQYLEPPKEPRRCPACGSIDISAGGRCLHCGTAAEQERAATEPPPLLVYIASPYADDPAGNTARTREYCRYVIDQGATPLAPHLLYPQFLDDASPAQRTIGIRCALQLLDRCDELWVFGERITAGMAREINRAKRRGIPIQHFEEAKIHEKRPNDR